jgi:hypothetical protein
MHSLQPAGISADREKFTLLLPVQKDDVAECLDAARVAAGERGLEPKEEFHITVIGFKTGKILSDLYAHRSPAERAIIVQALHDLAAKITWEATPQRDGRVYIEKEYTFRNNKKEIRRSIIQLLEVPAMEKFYEKLNSALGTQFQTPPPHITLYTAGGVGIGIDTRADLEALHPEQL